MQFFLYLIVGGLSFIVEISAFLALRRTAMAVCGRLSLTFPACWRNS